MLKPKENGDLCEICILFFYFKKDKPHFFLLQINNCTKNNSAIGVPVFLCIMHLHHYHVAY